MNESWVKEKNNKQHANNTNPLLVQKISLTAQVPERGSTKAAGYDLFSDKTTTTIQPNAIQLVPTGIAITCPPGTYGRIAPRSGLTIKHNINVLAGVIDPDYTGELIVVLFNFGQQPYTFVRGQRIAQIIFESILQPPVQVVKELPLTSRSTSGFGSTDARPTNQPSQIPTINKLTSDLNVSIEMPYDINLSLDPFDNYTHRVIQIKGSHPLLGLQLKICKLRNIPQIVECLKGTPAIRIPRWRSEIKNAYIIAVDNQSVQTIDQIQQCIQ